MREAFPKAKEDTKARRIVLFFMLPWWKIQVQCTTCSSAKANNKPILVFDLTHLSIAAVGRWEPNTSHQVDKVLASSFLARFLVFLLSSPEDAANPAAEAT